MLFKCLTYVCCFFLLAGFDFSKSTKVSTEITHKYYATWDFLNSSSFEQVPNELEKLKKYNFLFVPGFLSNLTIEAGQLPGLGFTEIDEYFNLQIDWLNENGFNTKRVAIESEASTTVNSKIIAKAILESDKPVVLVSHSKGGLDSLQAFIESKPLRSKVKGWIALQSPFWGSPIADAIDGNSYFAPVFAQLLKWLGGSSQSLKDLKVAEREVYMLENAQQVESITQAIPTIVFATNKSDKHLRWDTLLEPFRDYMQNSLKLKNDGLVPWRSAVLGYSYYINAEDVDHVMPVMHYTLHDYDKIRNLKALMILLGERLQN